MIVTVDSRSENETISDEFPDPAVESTGSVGFVGYPATSN